MAEFRVTPQTLLQTAGKIRGIDSKFNSTMGEIENRMRMLKNEWESEAATGFMNRFLGLKDNFENYSQVIKSYASFLEKASESYSTSERNISNATNNLFS